MKLIADIHGFPIKAGDVIRRFHYIHYRNRRKCYIVEIVYDYQGELRCIPCDDISRGRDDGYTVESVCRNWRVEIIHSYATGEDDYNSFFEREKVDPVPVTPACS